MPYNRIIFAARFYASGLHGDFTGCCIAGKARREQVDFVTGIIRIGRDATTQGQFEDVEVNRRPGLAVLRGGGFPVQRESCDNLEGDSEPDCHLPALEFMQVMEYLEKDPWTTGAVYPH